MKKFIFVLSIIGLLSALVCIGVSADPLVREDNVDPIDSGSLRVVPFHAPPIVRPLDTPIYCISSVSVNPGWANMFGYGFPQSYDEAVSSGWLITSLFVYHSSQFPNGVYYTDSVGQYVYFDSSSLTLYWGDVGIKPNRTDFNQWEVRLTSNSDIFTAYPTSGTYRQFVRSTIPPMLPHMVDTPITFFGQVLNFITGNTGLISLVGLSVALFCILPFGIGKVKEFIKGY